MQNYILFSSLDRYLKKKSNKNLEIFTITKFSGFFIMENVYYGQLNLFLKKVIINTLMEKFGII